MQKDQRYQRKQVSNLIQITELVDYKVKLITKVLQQVNQHLEKIENQIKNLDAQICEDEVNMVLNDLNKFLEKQI